MQELVHTERDGDTWIFTLHRAEKRNALSADMVDQLQRAVDAAHAAKARLLVFRGDGQSFCAGFDLSNLEASSEAELVLRFVRIELLLQIIANSPCLTLALAHGNVLGAGADLFAACKERVAATGAMFRMPGLKFGLVLGTRRFAEIVGREKARELLEATRTFDCQEALAMSFVHQVAAMQDWPGVIAAAKIKSEALEAHTQATLYAALGASSLENHADLSHLVRSAARPGLKERLQSYVSNPSKAMNK